MLVVEESVVGEWSNPPPPHTLLSLAAYLTRLSTPDIDIRNPPPSKNGTDSWHSRLHLFSFPVFDWWRWCWKYCDGTCHSTFSRDPVGPDTVQLFYSRLIQKQIDLTRLILFLTHACCINSAKKTGKSKFNLNSLFSQTTSLHTLDYQHLKKHMNLKKNVWEFWTPFTILTLTKHLK